MKRLAGIAATWVVLALPFSRSLLEASLAAHVLLQIVALAGVGYVLGTCLRTYWDGVVNRYNHWGIPGMLLAFFALLIWLLPRSLDASLLEPGWEVAKFVSVPLMIGLPLSFSWPHLTIIGRGFVTALFAAMLTAMGVLYRVAPQRLCTNYLIDAQQTLGAFALLGGLCLAVGCVFYVVAESRAD